MTRYLVTKCSISGTERYGITVMEGQDEMDCVDDIASTLAETLSLAAFLQENGVAAVHFRDVLEDWLAR